MPLTKLGELFKRIRRDKHLGQRSMAMAVNANASSWARYETGERWPSLQALHGVKKLLGIPLDQPLNQKGALPAVDVEELNESDREYLRAKWRVEARALGQALERKRAKWQRAIELRHVQAEELHSIQTELDHAEKSLELLEGRDTPPDLVQWQRQEAETLWQQKKRALNVVHFPDNAQLKLLEAEMEWLQLKREFLTRQAQEI